VPAERFRAGDVVRVRLAPERKRDGEGNPGLALELGPQAAMVVLDPSRRDILALVGGYGFRLGAFDRSLRAEREPGSSFKPFIYAAAIDSKRYTAATLVNDSPEGPQSSST
jgi:penicillin-binding protein 1A